MLPSIPFSPQSTCSQEQLEMKSRNPAGQPDLKGRKAWGQKDDYGRECEAPSNTESCIWLHREKCAMEAQLLLVKASFILYSHHLEDNRITYLSSKLNRCSCICSSQHSCLFFIIASNYHAAKLNQQ